MTAATQCIYRRTVSGQQPNTSCYSLNLNRGSIVRNVKLERGGGAVSSVVTFRWTRLFKRWTKTYSDTQKVPFTALSALSNTLHHCSYNPARQIHVVHSVCTTLIPMKMQAMWRPTGKKNKTGLFSLAHFKCPSEKSTGMYISLWVSYLPAHSRMHGQSNTHTETVYQ